MALGGRKGLVGWTVSSTSEPRCTFVEKPARDIGCDLVQCHLVAAEIGRPLVEAAALTHDGGGDLVVGAHDDSTGICDLEARFKHVEYQRLAAQRPDVLVGDAFGASPRRDEDPEPTRLRLFGQGENPGRGFVL